MDVYSFGMTFVKFLVSEYGIEDPITYNEDAHVNNIDVDLIANQLPELEGIKELISDIICAVSSLRSTFNELCDNDMLKVVSVGNKFRKKEKKV